MERNMGWGLHVSDVPFDVYVIQIGQERFKRGVIGELLDGYPGYCEAALVLGGKK